jgi:hypothetical protein
MRRVVVSVTPQGPVSPGDAHPGWTVACSTRVDDVDQEVAPDRVMSATEHVLALPSGPKRRLVVPSAGADDPANLAEIIARVVDQVPAAGDLAAYGSWLLDALFGPNWPMIEDLADQGGLELALTWSHDDPHLSSLLWEAMHARDREGAGSRQPLAALPRGRPLVAMTRLVDQAAGPRVAQPDLPITGVPRVLFAMGADPLDAHVRPGAMFLGLLRSIEAEGTCVSRVVTSVSVDDLEDACRRFQPDLVHLVAHGKVNSDDVVELTLNRELVGHRRITNAVGDAKAVFLSACDSARSGADQASLAASLVHDGIPVVVGMAGRIDVGACRLFTRSLVRAVMSGDSLIEAAATGRRAALLAGTDSTDELDWALPAVFMAAGLDPDQQLVDRRATDRAADFATRLGFDPTPAFVGRREILEAADALLPSAGETRDEGARRGALLAYATGSLRKLGAERVLREIASRYLRAGHVPLFLGPNPTLKPNSFVEIAAEILDVIVDVRRVLGLAERWPQTLPASQDPFSYELLEEAVRTFKETPAHTDDLKKRLNNDFEQLARDFALIGPPFGDHTHVAVLASEVHDWGLGLTALLKSLTGQGLGRAGPVEAERTLVPFIMTGVLDDSRGILLAGQGDVKKVGSMWELKMFEAAEAVAAYNLTMLQSGQRLSPPIFVPAFVAKEEHQTRWDEKLLDNFFTSDRSPANLGTNLWLLVLGQGRDEYAPIRVVGETDDAAIDQLSRRGP